MNFVTATIEVKKKCFHRRFSFNVLLLLSGYWLFLLVLLLSIRKFNIFAYELISMLMKINYKYFLLLSCNREIIISRHVSWATLTRWNLEIIFDRSLRLESTSEMVNFWSHLVGFYFGDKTNLQPNMIGDTRSFRVYLLIKSHQREKIEWRSR